jgi:iron complex outermembrane recepter protein
MQTTLRKCGARVSMLALLGGQWGAALGQQAPTAAGAGAAPETVLITASSRLQSSDFNAPTPTTSIDASQLQSTAPESIADALRRELPAFRTSSLTSTSTAFANLRNLGANRTLVLVDGRRIVPTQPDGTVDLNMIPSALIERAEVVTGGASAAWGSDAVAGVVNLTLKKRLQGIEADVQGGLSTYGDKGNYKASVAGGSAFADGRGHFIAGAEYARDYGIEDLQYPYFSRPWAYEERGSVGNSQFAKNGLPGVIYSDDVQRADVGPGGLITNGPLRGLLFGPNGTTSQFSYGQVYGNNMIGGASNFGETTTPGGQIAFPYERYTALTRVEYQFNDSLGAFLEANYGHALSSGYTNPNRNEGSVVGSTACSHSLVVSGIGAIDINIGNAYLPGAVVSQMQQDGISCFSMGRSYRDIPRLHTNDGSPYMWRGVGGLNGDLGHGWTWDAYYQYGANEFQQRRANDMNVIRMNQAVDAVVNPANGQIVCRSTLTNPTNGCVPIDLFGEGSITQAAYDYVFGTAMYNAKTTQQVAEANIHGEPVTLWAGPLAVAGGVGYRRESIDAVSDPISQALGWATGQRQGTAGAYDLKEAYAEVGLPLVRDMRWAKAIDLDAAIRDTDYSSSGNVVTWKVGGTYDILGGVLLRVSRSRDIRAGDLAELFTATQSATVNVQNPRTGSLGPTLQLTTGNPTLQPEKADTITGGVVFHPDWAPALRLSADWYDISIDDAIGTLTAQQTANLCYLNNLPQYCALITTNSAGQISGVTIEYQNLAKVHASGLDFEASYDLDLASRTRVVPGELTLRTLGNYYDDLTTTASPGATPTQGAGVYTNPHWSIFGSTSYALAGVAATVELQYFGGGKIDNTLTQGLIAPTGVNINHVGGTLYTNLYLQYGLANDRAALYLRVDNLFNVWPPFPSVGVGTPIFDVTGRAYTAGIRIKL